MKKLVLLSISFLLFFSISFSQPDSCSLRISLLTCDPGEELYSTFGHTAIRVQDPVSGTDIVFNYGTFEFNPEFYKKFVLSKLNYYLSMELYENFIYAYQYESRSVREQVFQLSCTEKERLFSALKENAKAENRYYKYDFLFDNCTTRARDIVRKNTDTAVSTRNILGSSNPTFRDLLHTYLDRGGQYWSKLGIDLLLGSKIDREVTNEESTFLPDYLLKAFDSTTVGSGQLVSAPQTILSMSSPLNKGSLFRPSIVFSVLAVLILVLSFFRSSGIRRTLRIFDHLFFLLLGLAGLILLFMWFGTDHHSCANNYNLFWALPTHIIMAFLLHLDRNWVRTYFRIVLWLTVGLCLSWIWLPQDLNDALLPLMFLIILRSWHHSKKRDHERKNN